jgi:mRNA degradation ribonuclease J1/J2
LDFGKNYRKEKCFYDPSYLEARCTEHLLELGILPKLPGIYKLKDNKKKEDHNIEGILISHPHGDHYDSIRFLKDDIPIYCGDITKEMLGEEFIPFFCGMQRKFITRDKLQGVIL